MTDNKNMILAIVLSALVILGWGFMPWSGGPFSWLDILGAPKAVEIADTLAATFGPRFAPPKLLRELAAADESFYGRFRPDQRAA